MLTGFVGRAAGNTPVGRANEPVAQSPAHVALSAFLLLGGLFCLYVCPLRPPLFSCREGDVLGKSEGGAAAVDWWSLWLFWVVRPRPA